MIQGSLHKSLCQFAFLYLILRFHHAVAACQREVNLGTTIVALEFAHGVVLAADTRTSVGGYVSHRYAKKITAVTDFCMVGRSGSAADTQASVKAARLVFADRVPATVSQVAHYFKNLLYENDLSASLIIAGLDKEQKTPRMFTLTRGVLLQEQRYCATGSGSTLALGYLDHVLDKESILTRDEAVQICRRAIELAMRRDASSGGVVRICICDQGGLKYETFGSSSKSETTL